MRIVTPIAVAALALLRRLLVVARRPAARG